MRAAELAYPLRHHLDGDERQRLPQRGGPEDRPDPERGLPGQRRRLVPGPPDGAAGPDRLAGRGSRLLPRARAQQLRAAERPSSPSPTCAKRSTASAATSKALLRLAGELGRPHPERILSIADLANRIISLKLEPDRHPIAGDSLGSLVRDAVGAARRRTNVSVAMKDHVRRLVRGDRGFAAAPGIAPRDALPLPGATDPF